MGKSYTQVSNAKRSELIKLIHNHGLKIKWAADSAGIYYPTAKAIYKVFVKENRVEKRTFR